MKCPICTTLFNTVYCTKIFFYSLILQKLQKNQSRNAMQNLLCIEFMGALILQMLGPLKMTFKYIGECINVCFFIWISAIELRRCMYFISLLGMAVYYVYSIYKFTNDIFTTFSSISSAIFVFYYKIIFNSKNQPLIEKEELSFVKQSTENIFSATQSEKQATSECFQGISCAIKFQKSYFIERYVQISRILEFVSQKMKLQIVCSDFQSFVVFSPSDGKQLAFANIIKFAKLISNLSLQFGIEIGCGISYGEVTVSSYIGFNRNALKYNGIPINNSLLIARMSLNSIIIDINSFYLKQQHQSIDDNTDSADLKFQFSQILSIQGIRCCTIEFLTEGVIYQQLINQAALIFKEQLSDSRTFPKRGISNIHFEQSESSQTSKNHRKRILPQHEKIIELKSKIQKQSIRDIMHQLLLFFNSIFQLSQKLRIFYKRKKSYQKLLLMQPFYLLSFFIATGPGILLLYFQYRFISIRQSFEFRINLYGMILNYSDWMNFCYLVVIIITVVQILCLIPMLIIFISQQKQKSHKTQNAIFEIDEIIQYLLQLTLITYYLMTSLQQQAVLQLLKTYEVQQLQWIAMPYIWLNMAFLGHNFGNVINCIVQQPINISYNLKIFFLLEIFDIHSLWRSNKELALLLSVICVYILSILCYLFKRSILNIGIKLKLISQIRKQIQQLTPTRTYLSISSHVENFLKEQQMISQEITLAQRIEYKDEILVRLLEFDDLMKQTQEEQESKASMCIQDFQAVLLKIRFKDSMTLAQFQFLQKCFKKKEVLHISYSFIDELKCIVLVDNTDVKQLENDIQDIISSLRTFLQQEKSTRILCTFGMLRGASLCMQEISFDVMGNPVDEMEKFECVSIKGGQLIVGKSVWEVIKRCQFKTKAEFQHNGEIIVLNSDV